VQDTICMSFPFEIKKGRPLDGGGPSCISRD
jgi:hypothetical protein